MPNGCAVSGLGAAAAAASRACHGRGGAVQGDEGDRAEQQGREAGAEEVEGEVSHLPDTKPGDPATLNNACRTCERERRSIAAASRPSAHGC